MDGRKTGAFQDGIEEKTIREMAGAMAAGEITAEQLTILYLEAIAEKDPNISSILELNPQAIQIAQRMDLERSSGTVRSLLHGIPILLKDNMDTGDCMHTSCGSLALQNHYAEEDAFLVKKLREAGAVILGKTNMTEWANFMSDRMTNGYSSRGGYVKNPYGPFDVGGSSSGAAASIAANLAAVSIGTETSGSIINPSAQNALCGIKPTVGLVSRRGLIPLSVTQDTAGPMARTVEDAVIALSCIVGFDEKDPVTYMAKQREGFDWFSALQKDGLQGARIGVARKIFEREISSEREELFEQAIGHLKAAGAEIIDDIDLGTMEDDLGYAVLMHEFKAMLNAYLSKTPSVNPIRSLSDIIAFNNEHPDETLKYGQAMLERAERLSGTLTEPSYINAYLNNRHKAGGLALRNAFDDYRISALVFPQNHGNSFSSAIGFPAVTVPADFTRDGEPFGITFYGKALSEPDLIKYAYAFEQKTKARRQP